MQNDRGEGESKKITKIRKLLDNIDKKLEEAKKQGQSSKKDAEDGLKIDPMLGIMDQLEREFKKLFDEVDGIIKKDESGDGNQAVELRKDLVTKRAKLEKHLETTRASIILGKNKYFYSCFHKAKEEYGKYKKTLLFYLKNVLTLGIHGWIKDRNLKKISDKLEDFGTDSRGEMKKEDCKKHRPKVSKENFVKDVGKARGLEKDDAFKI